MKRYTVKPPQGITSLGSKYGVIQDVMDNPNELFKLFDKLGAYEDTGLEPGEILTGVQLAEIACMQIRYRKMQELLEQAAEDIENCYGRETKLSGAIRKELN